MDKQTISLQLREQKHIKNIEDLQQAQVVLKIALTSIEIVEQTLFITEEKIKYSKSITEIIKEYENQNS